LGVRHGLANRGASPEEAADAVVALHATDPATVYLAVRARARCEVVGEVGRALYEDKSLLRMLGMRRTMFVVSRSLAPVVQAACSADIAKKQRKLLVGHLSTQGYPDNVADADAWLAEVEESAAAALSARGTATAQQLSADEPRLRQQLIMAKGKPYESIGGVTSRVLFQLAVDGRIVRGRPRGSWISTQYEWSTVEDWLPGGLPELSAEAARTELARRWLFAFGPAPVTDLRWWTGWTAGQTTKSLAEIGPVEVDVDGVACLVLPDDVEPTVVPNPWVALLPALDPTPMGWQQRDFYLGAHREPLFDRTGNIGPTILSDGRIVGAWAQRASGEVVYRLLEDVGADVEAAITAEANHLEEWFGTTRVIPKFRTPLEKTLSS
jgi:hypothetical protein